MPRTLITGGAGFLGSHLCDRFVAEGHEVICMDNLVTGSTGNIDHLIGKPNFSFVHYDVTNYIHVGGPLDYVLHFASPASPIDYLKLPIQTLKVGSIGTHKALGLAKAKNARFLLASTSETYGDPAIHPQPETYWGNVNPIGIRGVYDEAKRFAEALTMAYHRYHALETRIVRIFNTYGERMRIEDGRAIPAFITQALRSDPITVFGDGSQSARGQGAERVVGDGPNVPALVMVAHHAHEQRLGAVAGRGHEHRELVGPQHGLRHGREDLLGHPPHTGGRAASLPPGTASPEASTADSEASTAPSRR